MSICPDDGLGMNAKRAKRPDHTGSRWPRIAGRRTRQGGFAMPDRDKIYIDGSWVPSTGGGTIEVVNASTEEVMGRIPDGTPEDVAKAVAAAKRAFPDWSATDKEERGKYLQRITEG